MNLNRVSDLQNALTSLTWWEARGYNERLAPLAVGVFIQQMSANLMGYDPDETPSIMELRNAVECELASWRSLQG